MRSAVSLLLVSLLYANPLSAQVNREQEARILLDRFLEQKTDEVDASVLEERVNEWLKQPLDLNKVTSEQLSEVFFLTVIQQEAILKEREKRVRFTDLLELQAISVIDQEAFAWIQLLFEVRERSELRDFTTTSFITNSRHDLMLRFSRGLQTKKGYSASGSSAYLGNQNKEFLRYRMSWKNSLSASFVAEKDPGERNHLDFWSANISLRFNGFIKRVELGDYEVQAGQGLLLWTGLSFGKGFGLAGLVKPQSSLRSYRSVNEADFFRGIAAELGFNKFTTKLFYSNRRMDANLSSDSLITSLPEDGFHRTLNELKRRRAASQQAAGVVVQHQSALGTIGIQSIYTSYSHEFAASDDLYEQFIDRPKKQVAGSISYNKTLSNTHLFAEAAKGKKDVAFLAGIISSLSPGISAGMLYRRYPANNISPFAQSISENSEPRNEEGFILSLQVMPNKRWVIDTYLDQFKFPWLKYQVDAPTSGFEYGLSINYIPSKTLRLSYRLKAQQKAENAVAVFPIKNIERATQINNRVELFYNASTSWSFRNRIELTNTSGGGGLLFYQDVIYKPLSSKISGNLRYAIFDTDNYDSRIYAFENDVLYSYSIPAYQNRGIRTYLNLRYQVVKGLDIWGRYAITRYANLNKLGSGSEEIAGNRQSDFKLQLRYQF